MKIVAKKMKFTNDIRQKKSIKNGLQELRREYAPKKERNPVALKGDKNTLTFVTSDITCVRHILEVLDSHAIPHNFAD